MMVIDTSAIVALLDDEPDAELYERAVATAEAPCMSAASALECAIVSQHRFGDAGAQAFDLLVHEQGIEIVAFDVEQLTHARAAYRRFGRGRHAARLNYGDCFSYALAKQRGFPLLFKGTDFGATDVGSVL